MGANDGDADEARTISNGWTERIKELEDENKRIRRETIEECAAALEAQAAQWDGLGEVWRRDAVLLMATRLRALATVKDS